MYDIAELLVRAVTDPGQLTRDQIRTIAFCVEHTPPAPRSHASYAWAEGRTAKGGLKAVGSAEHSGRTLYGKRAEAALRSQGKRDGTVDKPPTAKQRAAVASATKRQAKQDTQAAAQAAVNKALTNPKSLTPADLTALSAHLKTLPAAQMKALAKQVKAAVSGTKAQLAERLYHYAKTGEVQKPSRTKGTPHERLRGALDELGVNHRHLSDEQLVGMLHGQHLPEPAAAPAPSRESLEQGVMSSVDDLLAGKFSSLRMVPIHELRKEVEQKFGGSVSAKDFNELLLDLRRTDKVRLVSIDDRSRATPEQLRDSVHAVGETFFYLEKISP